MVYAWEKELFPIKVEEAVEVLDKLIDRGKGKVTRDDILAEAGKVTSPLHGCIEWDNGKAAEKYRRGQVRSIVSGIKRADRNGKPTHQRAYVYVQPDDGDQHKAYVKLDVAMRNTGMRRQMLQTAWREMARLRRKYANYKELERVFAIMRREAEKSPEAKEA